MALEIRVIDRLFHRLFATYGSAFSSKWVGQEMNEVKSIWAHELSGFSGDLESISYALENLPSQVPNAIEFKQLCRQAPRTEVPAIEHGKVDPEIVKIIISKLKPAVPKPHGMKQWAYNLKYRHDAGEKISQIQLTMYQAALANQQ